MTKSERHERITEVFLEACKLASDQRGAFLDERCGDDADLRAEIEAMLAAEDKTGGALQAPALGPGFRLSWSAGQAGSAGGPHPKKIADYRILDVVGEGGMGVVYRAEQDSPRRVVALKVIKSGLATPKMLKRFEHEAAILGRLQHPGIAQIFEAGIADAGAGPQPFFAMEFIEGQPLTKFADSQDLGTRERLSLFTKVCDALQHAHQKGVIHRDLKPVNILVDSSGQPKILDFGVARAIDLDIQTTTLRTDVAQPIGTLPYMSPEQTVGDADQLDTRSDVYALGVLAYELLAGRLPYDVSRKMVHEAVRIIREEDPTPLSAVNKVFRGDLETIVAKALEKDTQRRYQSASDFAADIHRYLKDEPIVARPPSSMYLLRKFTRRNRALVTGLGVVLVVMAVSLMGITAALHEARQQRVIAEDQRDRAVEAEKMAQAQRLEAEAVSAFLNDALLGLAHPELEGPDVTLGELLDIAADTIADSFGDQPLSEARLRATIGSSYQSLGKFEEAELHLQRALEIRETELGEEHADTLHITNNLATLYLDQGRYDDAELLLRRAFEVKKRVLGEDDPSTLTGAHNLGELFRLQGRWDQAAELLISTLEIQRRVFGEDAEDSIATMNALGAVRTAQGQLSEAEMLMSQALAASRQLRGDEHPGTFISMTNLATILSRQGKYAGAEALMLEALEGFRLLEGEEHPHTLHCMSTLMGLHLVRGRYPEAEQLGTKALEIARRLLGDENPTTLAVVEQLASAYTKQGRYDDARPLMINLLEVRREKLGAEHPGTLGAMISLADLHKKQGRYDAAESLLTTVMEVHRRDSGEEHARTLLVMDALASLYVDQGRYEEAETLFVKALKVSQRALGKEHPQSLALTNNLGLLYQKQRRPAQAEPLFIEVLEYQRRELGEEHPGTISVMNNLAMVLYDMGRYNEAEPLYVKALEFRRRVLGAEHPHTLGSLNNLANLYKRQQRYEMGEPLLAEAVKSSRRVLGRDHPSTLHFMSNLANLYWSQERFEKAEPLYVGALEMRRGVLGEKHPDTLQSVLELARLYRKQGRSVEAEPLLRECLDIRRAILPADDWRIFNTQSTLGEALVGQKKFAEAEPLLLESYAKLIENPETIPKPVRETRLSEALERIVKLYEAWPRPDKAAEWRAKLPPDAEEAEKPTP